MAPGKPTKQTQSEKMSAKKTCKSGVSKRPARGYHKFRSGFLNVAPKGAEKKLVKENQGSALLRLPSEIRDCIWKLVLEGKVFLATTFEDKYNSETYRFAPPAVAPSNGMALLRTCRQIYSEAALYSMKRATFAYDDVPTLKRSARALTTYQRNQVVHIRQTCPSIGHVARVHSCMFVAEYLDLKKTFPALRQITVLLHDVTEDDVLEEATRYIRHSLRITLEDTGCNLVVESTPEAQDSYYRKLE